jgi:hypothetical protein
MLAVSIFTNYYSHCVRSRPGLVGRREYEWPLEPNLVVLLVLVFPIVSMVILPLRLFVLVSRPPVGGHGKSSERQKSKGSNKEAHDGLVGNRQLPTACYTAGAKEDMDFAAPLQTSAVLRHPRLRCHLGSSDGSPEERLPLCLGLALPRGGSSGDRNDRDLCRHRECNSDRQSLGTDRNVALITQTMTGWAAKCQG